MSRRLRAPWGLPAATSWCKSPQEPPPNTVSGFTSQSRTPGARHKGGGPKCLRHPKVTVMYRWDLPKTAGPMAYVCCHVTGCHSVALMGDAPFCSWATVNVSVVFGPAALIKSLFKGSGLRLGSVTLDAMKHEQQGSSRDLLHPSLVARTCSKTAGP